MDGNHRVGLPAPDVKFREKGSPGSGPPPFLSCVAGRGQRLEQVVLRDDVKASPGNRIQDSRIIDTARVVLAVLPGSGVVVLGILRALGRRPLGSHHRRDQGHPALAAASNEHISYRDLSIDFREERWAGFFGQFGTPVCFFTVPIYLTQ
jgi:hypothetical protein